MKRLKWLLFIYACLMYPTPGLALGATQVIIITQYAETAIAAEVALSRSEQETGLMHRASLAENHGMLFPLPYPRPMRMWMKDTLIPLDMLFIDEQKRIIYLKENATPKSLAAIGPGKNIIAVLELPGGTIQKLRIAVGDTVRYRLAE